MYESFFHLGARPFLTVPLADRYYAAASVEYARETAMRCIERGEGPAIVLGAAGTGKSTVCQVIAEQMREKFRVAVLASARLCTRRALLQNILFELKQPYRDREEGELRLSLIDFLEPSESCPHGMLLIVDEANVLPLRLLEEIRMLTNLVRDGQPRVRLVLAASLALEERLASPRLESFNQRIAARCYLQSMNRDETCGYIRAQISAVGGEPDAVFSGGALHAVYRATDGVPRLVNQVCDHVLVMAAVGHRKPIDEAAVEEAWADLQQLPAPWSETEQSLPASNDSSSILEFGELDDPLPGQLDLGEEPNESAQITEPEMDPQVTVQLDAIETGLAELAGEQSAVEPLEDEPAVADLTSSDEASFEPTAVATPPAITPESAPESTPESVTDIAAEKTTYEAQPQFRPSSGKRPEIELIFHHAHDPFNEPFDEEEVLVDPLSSLETLQSIPEVRPVVPPGSPTIPFQSVDEQVATAQQSMMAPEPPTWRSESVLETVAESISDAADNGMRLPGDDRDLLVVQDDVSENTSEYSAVKIQRPPRRRAYRQLFTNLRHK